MFVLFQLSITGYVFCRGWVGLASPWTAVHIPAGDP